MSESGTDSTVTETDDYETGWHSTDVSETHFPNAADADEDLSDFNFANGPISAAFTQGSANFDAN